MLSGDAELLMDQLLDRNGVGMDESSIKKANEIFEKGDMQCLYNHIKPFLEKNDPYAYYFSSRFSLAEWNESEEDYDKRYIEALLKAAEGGVVEAMYRLSSLFLVGDPVEMDVDRGKRYLDRAFELGYGPAKLSLAVNLYYGSNGYAKDIERSIELVSEAEKEGVEGASQALSIFRSE